MEEEGRASERPADATQRMPPPDETQRIPEPAPEAPAPWAQEPARREESGPPFSPPGGTETTAFGVGMPGVPSPYGPAPAPAPPAYTPAGYTAPPAPPTPPAAPAYTPPPVYGPLPGSAPAMYGGYGAAPVVPAANGTAIAALVCGILAIVLACSLGPLGAIMGAVALVLANQYIKQHQQSPQQPVNPSDATYVQVGRVTGGIGLAIGLVYTVLIGCYFLLIFFAIFASSTSGGGTYP
jgi:hypothetical protein